MIKHNSLMMTLLLLSMGLVRGNDTHSLLPLRDSTNYKNKNSTIRIGSTGNNSNNNDDTDTISTATTDRNLFNLKIIPAIRDYIEGSPNPCIVRSIIQAGSASCERVIVPTGFCQTCGVNTDIQVGGENNGDYMNCLYLSRLESLTGSINQQCINKLDQYFALNTCDTYRHKALQRYNRWIGIPKFLQSGLLRKLRSPSRQILDAFIYAMCELPCDCIPQYDADYSIPSYDVTRGNCQGHAEVDLCAVYPNIKLIHGQYTNMSLPTPEELQQQPYICPSLKEWRTQHPGPWFDLTPTPIEPHVEDFLHYTIDATEVLHITNVSANPLWQQCFYLEDTQQRILPTQR